MRRHEVGPDGCDLPLRPLTHLCVCVFPDKGTLKFEMKGCSPSVANALRRILLSEVPTMAIEHVFMVNNTSVIYDEVLSHRLGLVPLRIDPRRFEFRAAGEAASESNTVVFRLNVKCDRPPRGEGPGAKMVVASDQLEWLPHGSELPEEAEQKLTRFGETQDGLLPSGAAAVDANIVLAKLAPGQEIELEAHAVKGLGKTHAKWSPVGTAWYDLCPEVVLLQPITGADATAFLEESHPEGWDAQRPGTGGRFHSGQQGPCFDVHSGQLRVLNSRGCRYCLEKLRHMSGDPRWSGKLQVRRIKEHYLFTIESVGQLEPEELFTEAVRVLREKCARLMQQL